MPQLDKVAFLSQFFWLCLFYFSFYYVTLKFFLPQISRILTLRQKKINLSPLSSFSLQQENQQVRENLDNIMAQGFSLSKNIFNDFLISSNNWLENNLTNANKLNYKTVNNLYIQSLGDAYLSKKVSFYNASTHHTEKLKLTDLVEKTKGLKDLLSSNLQLNLNKKNIKISTSSQVKQMSDFSNITIDNKNNKKSKNKK